MGPEHALPILVAMSNADVGVGLAQTYWDHASRGVLRLKTGDEQTGSSAMPHKINPIVFEQAEGAFKVAASTFLDLYKSNINSRGLRDLSGSIINRRGLEAWAYLYLGVINLQEGVSTSSYNQDAIKNELRSHPECLTELVRYKQYMESGSDDYFGLKERPPVDFETTFQYFSSLYVSNSSPEALDVSPFCYNTWH